LTSEAASIARGTERCRELPGDEHGSIIPISEVAEKLKLRVSTTLEAAEKNARHTANLKAGQNAGGRARLQAVPQFVADIEGFSPWGTLFYLIQLTLTARKNRALIQNICEVVPNKTGVFPQAVCSEQGA
jgi:hypothetical protein